MARSASVSRLHVPPRALDAVVALALLSYISVELSSTPDPGTRAGTAAAYLLAAAFTLPYVVHRDHPLPVVVVSSVATVVYSAGHFTGFPGFASFVLVFGVTLHTTRGLVAYAAGLVALSVSLALQSGVVVTVSTWVSTLLVLTVAWLGAEYVKTRRARWTALEERAHRLEAEQQERAARAVDEERMRIARELHDVVAHSMSVVAVQAGVAHHVIDERPELARQALSAIETTSRAALVELRRMLGVLRRADDDDPALGPSAGLLDLHRLVSQFADAGLDVRLSVTGDAEAVPPGVGLSAYRIAQESLTNVLKHGAPQATVDVRCDPSVVVVEVHDPGRGGAEPRTVPGAGHGLVGMRERVAVFDGRLDAGPDGHGGFRLVATLPSEVSA